MTYDADLADRIREVVAPELLDERRMFGGLAFFVGGHLAVAASGQGGLMVRVPPEDTQTYLSHDHVTPMVMAGRETRGWIRVSDDGVTTTRQLRTWVTRGLDYARSLPPK